MCLLVRQTINVDNRMSDKEDQLIDEIDLALFRILRSSHDLRTTKKNTELINAIRHARCLSYGLLPAAKRRTQDVIL